MSGWVLGQENRAIGTENRPLRGLVLLRGWPFGVSTNLCRGTCLCLHFLRLGPCGLVNSEQKDLKLNDVSQIILSELSIA